jgi:adenylate kinase family enzyme
MNIKTKPWGYVIDGYPRTIEQAKDLESRLPRLDMVLLIDCTEKYCTDRLAERRKTVSACRNRLSYQY